MYYEEYGSGAPLLCLHGNGGSHKSFYPVIDELEKHFRCILPDSRWQGKTTKGTQSLTYPLLSQDMLGFLQAIGVNEPVSIVGYSDGGIMALECARNNPQIDRVVTLGANWDTTGTTPEFEAWAQKTLRRAEKWSFFSCCRRKAELIKLMLEEDRYPDYKGLREVHCPVLLMVGDADVIPYDHTLWMKDELPNARISIVSDCGHSIMRTRPDVFIDTAISFLTQND